MRNGGDFLISARAKKLLRALRPDREIVELNRWEQLTPDRLEIVNGSAGLLLTGGPSLRFDMYPQIYPLTGDLDDICCPIMAFGVGWSSSGGTWGDVASYPLSNSSKELLTRIDQSGFPSGLRDYRSAGVVEKEGFKNFRVTGCPALYASIDAQSPPSAPAEVRRVCFSLGVEFVRSSQFENQTKAVIAACRDAFPQAELVVALHHGIVGDITAPGADVFWRAHRRFFNWLSRNGIPHADLSGGATASKRFYETVDLHIGYRVTPIFICSA